MSPDFRSLPLGFPEFWRIQLPQVMRDHHYRGLKTKVSAIGRYVLHQNVEHRLDRFGQILLAEHLA